MFAAARDVTIPLSNVNGDLRLSDS